jgi:hypothetical protein
MKKYYIHTRPFLFTSIYQEVDGEPLDIFPNLDLFIHKNADGYVISEATSGCWIIGKSTRQECIDSAYAIDVDKITSLIADFKKSPYNYVTDETEKNTFKIGMEVYTKNRTSHGEILGFTNDDKIWVRMIAELGFLDTYLPFDVLSKHNLMDYSKSESELDIMFGEEEINYAII